MCCVDQLKPPHNPDFRPLAILGLLTATLPTFGAECQLIAAFQTQRQTVLKVALWHKAEVQRVSPERPLTGA